MCRKFLAALLGIIFSLTFPLVLYAYNFKIIFLRPQIYHEILKNGQISKAVNSLIQGTLTTALQEAQQKGGTQGLPVNAITEATANAVNNMLSPEWLEGEIGRLADNFFAWLYFEKDELDLKISLKEVKKNLGPAFTEIFTASIEGMPTCTAEEMQRLAQGDTKVLCLPKGMTPQDITKYTQTMNTDDLLKKIPEEIDFLNLTPGASAKTLDFLKSVRSYIHLGFLILNISLAALGVALILIGLLVWKPLAAVLKAVGSTILAPTILLLISAVSSWILVEKVKFSQLIRVGNLNLGSGVDPTMFDGIGAIFTSLVSRFSYYKTWEAGIILIVSIILLVVGAILKKRIKKSIPAPAKETK